MATSMPMRRRKWILNESPGGWMDASLRIRPPGLFGKGFNVVFLARRTKLMRKNEASPAFVVSAAGLQQARAVSAAAPSFRERVAGLRKAYPRERYRRRQLSLRGRKARGAGGLARGRFPRERCRLWRERASHRFRASGARRRASRRCGFPAASMCRGAWC